MIVLKIAADITVKRKAITILNHFLQPVQYSKHMGGVPHLDSYFDNLRLCNSGSKLYWMQLIKFVKVLQVAAF